MTITYTNDVDAPVRTSKNIEFQGASNISTQVFAQAPLCGPGTVSNLAVPNAPPIGNYTATAPAQVASGTQPTEPPFF